MSTIDKKYSIVKGYLTQAIRQLEALSQSLSIESNILGSTKLRSEIDYWTKLLIQIRHKFYNNKIIKKQSSTLVTQLDIIYREIQNTGILLLPLEISNRNIEILDKSCNSIKEAGELIK